MKELHEKTISEVNPIEVWTKNGFWELNEERGKEKGMKPIKVFTEKDIKQWAIAIVKICQRYLQNKIDYPYKTLPKWIQKLKLNDDGIAGMIYGFIEYYELTEEDLK